MDGVKLEEQLRSSFESAIYEPRGGLSEELDVFVSSEDDDPIFSMATVKEKELLTTSCLMVFWRDVKIFLLRYR